MAFDVYELAFGRGAWAYGLRVFAMVIALGIFLALFLPCFLYFVIAAGGLFDARGWAGLWRHHWGGSATQKGMMRRMGPLLREYFRFDFHPWQHNNSALLKPLQPPSASAGGSGGKAARRRSGEGGGSACVGGGGGASAQAPPSLGY